MTRKTSTIVGAAVGMALFLAVGLLPALLYGGYAGVMLAGAVTGTPVSGGFLARAFIVVGMVVGVTGVAALFAAGGAVVGAAVAALAGVPVAKKASKGGKA